MDAPAVPPVIFALSLGPAVAWGFTPVIEKRALSNGGRPLQAALTVIVVDTVLYVLALLARGEVPFVDLSAGTLAVFVAAGVFGTALGRIAIFAGNARVGASVSSAVVSARPLFATALAVGFLGEPVGLTTAVGVVVLVCGLAALSVAKGGDLAGWETRDLLVPLAAAVSFAVGNVLRRYGLGVGETTPLEAVALNEFAALVALLAYVVARGRRDVFTAPPRTYLVFAVSGVLTAGALLAMFTALSMPAGRVAVVDPLIATAPLFTTVFSYFLLSDLERVTRGIVAGALLVVVGAALVTV
jgi:drug/metabolite transporter (DMT)-like permease